MESRRSRAWGNGGEFPACYNKMESSILVTLAIRHSSATPRIHHFQPLWKSEVISLGQFAAGDNQFIGQRFTLLDHCSLLLHKHKLSVWQLDQYKTISMHFPWLSQHVKSGRKRLDFKTERDRERESETERKTTFFKWLFIRFFCIMIGAHQNRHFSMLKKYNWITSSHDIQ